MKKLKKCPFSNLNYNSCKFGRKKPKFIPFKKRYQKSLKNSFLLVFNYTKITTNLVLKKVGLKVHKKISQIVFIKNKNGKVSFLPINYFFYLLKKQKNLKHRKNNFQKKPLQNKLIFFLKTIIFSIKSTLFIQFFPNVNPIAAKKYSRYLQKNYFLKKRAKRTALYKFL
jgi:hypothetical protein